MRRTRILIGLWSLLAAACGARAGVEAKRPVAPAPAAASLLPAPSAAGTLYDAYEALADALSSPLEHVGTGHWPGINRSTACVFRNDRVLVVNVYCTLTEVPAFRVDVYSPKRGRVRIYAESTGPISLRSRWEYFTFVAETEPPPGPSAGLPSLLLTMSFDELRAYDERRYQAFLPSCYGTVALSGKRANCLGPLAARTPEWTERHRAFLEYASDDWYKVVHDMREMAARYGTDPEGAPLQ